MSEKEKTKKNFNFWVLLNWKTGDVKIYKLEPADKKIGAYHIPVEIDLDVLVPDKPDVKASGTIEMEQSKIDDMVIESL